MSVAPPASSGPAGAGGPQALTEALIAVSRFAADDANVAFSPADAVLEAASLAAAVAESAPRAGTDWVTALSDPRICALLAGSGRPIPMTIQDFFDAASRGRRWRAAPTAGVDALRAVSMQAATSYARLLAEVASAACGLGEPTLRVVGNATVTAAAQVEGAAGPARPAAPTGVGPSAGTGPLGPIGSTILPTQAQDRGLDVGPAPDITPSRWPGLSGLPGVDEIIARLRGVQGERTPSAGDPEPWPVQRRQEEAPGAPRTATAPAPAAESAAPAAPPEPEPTLEELLAELDALIGLGKVKQEVHRQAQLLRVEKLRAEAGLKTPPMTRHLVFAGNPGTGKTTVARLVGKIYKSLGVLPTGQLIEVDRSELVAGYLGQTATRTSEVIAKAVGGVLFIDEAYSLAGDQYGQEAIDTLVKEMEDHRDSLVVIVAGYPMRMAEFIATNPGLESRFRTLMLFDDYTDDELVAIFTKLAASADYHPTPQCLTRLRAMLAAVERGEGFGNGRYARNLLEGAIGRQAWRLRDVAVPTLDQLRELTDVDLDETDLDEQPPSEATPSGEPAGNQPGPAPVEPNATDHDPGGQG